MPEPADCQQPPPYVQQLSPEYGPPELLMEPESESGVSGYTSPVGERLALTERLGAEEGGGAELCTVTVTPEELTMSDPLEFSTFAVKLVSLEIDVDVEQLVPLPQLVSCEPPW